MTLRAFQRFSASAAVLARSTGSAPCSRQNRAMAAARSSTSRGWPSTATSSRAAAAGGHLKGQQLPDAVQGDPVHEFQGSGGQPRGEDLAHGLGRGRQGPEARRQGLPGRGLGHQPQDDAGDHPQGAFRAQKQPGEVVAHHPFHGAAAGVDDLAGGQHHGEPQDVVPGDAVLHRHRAPGAFGHVAADGAELGAGRVRRIVEALGLHLPFQAGPG